MRASLLALLLASAFVSFANASPARAKQKNSWGAPGCGPAEIKFDVKTDEARHAAPAPEAGKALVVFLQDDAEFGSRPRPTTRFAVDGTWVGATHANSFFYVAVGPGEHHVCANWQNRVSLFKLTRATAAAHFTAEAGKTYYFRGRDIAITGEGGAVVSEPEVKLAPLDGDEAQILMRSFTLSVSHAKK
jgi:Protein of unknown function (DUF2846)